jgi:hypothetical protein
VRGPLEARGAGSNHAGAAANFLCTFNYRARVIDVTFEWQKRVYAAIKSDFPRKNKIGLGKIR